MFHKRLRRAVANSGLSERAISQAVGRSGPYLTNLFRSGSTPDFLTGMELCKVLQITPDYLFGQASDLSIAPERDAALISQEVNFLVDAIAYQAVRRAQERGGELSTDAFLDWWRSSGGRISEMEKFDQFVDVFFTPDDGGQTVNPFRLSSDSLAVRTFGTSDASQFTSIVQHLGEGFNLKIRDDHLKTAHGMRPQIDHMDMDAALPNGVRVQGSYRRILVPLVGPTGETYVGNYSMVIDRLPSQDASK